ncbi:MAG TPA: hypothetical protein VKM72_08990 [Thermoanaerobaculia bacterium]|nr:hypothetical protein [Thermoanaerobaculia bacterium]
MPLSVERNDDDFQVPADGPRIIRQNIKRLFLGTNTSKAHFDNIGFAEVEILTPHKIFIAGLPEIETNDALVTARCIGWRYLLFAKRCPFAAAELSAMPNSQDVRFSRVVRNPGVSATFDILNSLGNRISDDSYELRFLRMRDIDFSGLWFHSYTHRENDFLRVLPPAPQGMEAGAEYPRDQFLGKIRDVANHVRESFLMSP